MFRAEVRFYLELAPVVGLRVPVCYRAEEGDYGTHLVLEDLSAWKPGADPTVTAKLLADMHARWEGRVPGQWPWLRPAGAAADLVQELFDRTWPGLSARDDLTPRVRELGDQLVGRVVAAEREAADAGRLTLVHGDASMRNLRSSSDGEVVFLDWEDVAAAPGVTDLSWLLLSSVEEERWDAVIAAYGATPGLVEVLPAAVVQGLLTLADAPVGSDEATGWVHRLESAHRWLRAA